MINATSEFHLRVPKVKECSARVSSTRGLTFCRAARGSLRLLVSGLVILCTLLTVKFYVRYLVLVITSHISPEKRKTVSHVCRNSVKHRNNPTLLSLDLERAAVTMDDFHLQSTVPCTQSFVFIKLNFSYL